MQTNPIMSTFSRPMSITVRGGDDEIMTDGRMDVIVTIHLDSLVCNNQQTSVHAVLWAPGNVDSVGMSSSSILTMICRATEPDRILLGSCGCYRCKW